MNNTEAIREAFFLERVRKWYQEKYGREYFPLGLGECPHMAAFIGGYDSHTQGITPKEEDFTYQGIISPYVFLQWKGTNTCFDFHCECGAHCHFDGYFAYTVQCPHCKITWQMPFNLFPRKVDERTDEYWKENPQMLEEDEDMRVDISSTPPTQSTDTPLADEMKE